MNQLRIRNYLKYLLIFFPVLCQADAGWTAYGSIAELTVNEKGRIVVRLDVSENDTECRDKKTFYHEQHGKGSGYILPVLLKALAEDKKVRVYQTSVCDLKNYSYIYAVGIIP